MRRGEALFLFLLFLQPAFSSYASSCVQVEPLVRFWNEPNYVQGNPFIAKFWGLTFYSFEFDNASQSLGITQLTLADKDYFNWMLAPEARSELLASSERLKEASESLLMAKNASLKAHVSSVKAKNSIKELQEKGPAYLVITAPLLEPTPKIMASALSEILNIYEVANYILSYHESLWSAYSNSFDTFDRANEALLALADKVDEKMKWLSDAGAGEPHYTGKAQRRFFEAKSQLSPTSPICLQAQQGRKIASRASSRPDLPSFEGYGFSSYLEKIAGRQNSSSIMQLAAIYSSLSQAQKEMNGEYQSARLSAQAALSSLETKISLLSDEKLHLIPDSPAQAGNLEGGIEVSPVSSGIYSGFLAAREGLVEAQAILRGAEASYANTAAPGYLADAISKAQSAEKKANYSLLSVALVLKNAQEAVSFQKELADTSIERVQQKISAYTPSSMEEAKAKNLSSSLLQRAIEMRSKAAYLPSLGEKFSAYAEATRLASHASAALQQSGLIGIKSEAQRQLSEFSGLVRNAKADGLDVSYEEWKLSQYMQLLSSTELPEVADAIIAALKDDEEALLERLSQAYSGLPAKYQKTKAIVENIRSESPGFLPEFDSLSSYFLGGSLFVKKAAGRLKEIDSQLDYYSEVAQKSVPKYLSAILSKNAWVSQLRSPAVLGGKSDYLATILTKNPSTLSYSAEVSFQAKTDLPIHSSDFSFGDRIVDAYPEMEKTTIVLPEVQAQQSYSFTFSKSDSPAQVNSVEEWCKEAYSSSAYLTRNIKFFASRDLERLLIEEKAPDGVAGGTARFAGRETKLSPKEGAGTGTVLAGEINSVRQGANSVEVSFVVPSPFKLSESERSYLEIGPGKRRVSYTLVASDFRADCEYAKVVLEEPFSSVSELSVQSISGARAERLRLDKGASKTTISFYFSPMRRHQSAEFLVSYTIEDLQSAVSESLANAELQVALYKKPQDASLLAQAKLLIGQNRLSEALSILSKINRNSADYLSFQAEQEAFAEENRTASYLLFEASSTQSKISAYGASERALKLSSLILKLNSSIVEAQQAASEGSLSKAASQLRRAQSEFREALSSLSWKAASDSSAAYAKARKEGAEAGVLSEAAQKISEANSLFAAGNYLGALSASSQAEQILSSFFEGGKEAEAQAAAELERIDAEFSRLGQETDQLLLKYSAQYASLSAQGKRQLPISPSAAQQRIDDAEKGLAAAKKQKPSIAGLRQANSSYQKLVSVSELVRKSLENLNSSAHSSLSVAKAALAEVKRKASPGEEKEVSQIEAEVKRAEEYLSLSLLADSILASERAIGASSAFLSKKGSGQDTSIILGVISILFIAAAAYYFIRKPRQEKKPPKKPIPKAGST
ncbi:MAG: hypothetical protein N3G22_00235 [Candidatus Micrarchaeota archaeon]|nr:hypothetical protein [Candidatus Micrarchaeota archaeon]